MKVAKWISALGGSCDIHHRRSAVGYWPLPRACTPASSPNLHLLPTANLTTLNFWSQIAFAFIGLELAPIVSAEISQPPSRSPASRSHQRHRIRNLLYGRDRGAACAVEAGRDQSHDRSGPSRTSRRAGNWARL